MTGAFGCRLGADRAAILGIWPQEVDRHGVRAQDYSGSDEAPRKLMAGLSNQHHVYLGMADNALL